MTEEKESVQRAEFEANRTEHESMMARMAADHEANRADHEANRADHEANRADHEVIVARLDGLDRAMVKLGVEFEQHRRDTRVLADGILGLVRDPLSVTASLVGAG